MALAALLPAIRTRVLHAWALSLGCPPAALSHRHVDALDALVTDWRGQGPTHLPGGVIVGRGSTPPILVPIAFHIGQFAEIVQDRRGGLG